MNSLLDGTLLIFVAVACVALSRPFIATCIGALGIILILR